MVATVGCYPLAGSTFVLGVRSDKGKPLILLKVMLRHAIVS